MTRVLFGHATFPESKKKGVENLGAIDGISASGTVRTMYAKSMLSQY